MNKVASAVHLRFDIAASSLPEDVKLRLLALRDGRITLQGVLWSSRPSNTARRRPTARTRWRLQTLVDSVARRAAPRRATRPAGLAAAAAGIRAGVPASRRCARPADT